MIKTLKNILWPVLAGLTLLALLGLGGSGLVLYREANAVHPLLGWAVILLATLAVVLLLVVPVARFASLPRPITRPSTTEGPEWNRYLLGYGRRLVRNRKVRDGFDGHARLEAALNAARDRHAPEGALPALEKEIEGAVAHLDEQARGIISRHAAAVFTATAVSQSGRLDTAIVMSAQLRMVKEIGELYYQRPGLRDLWRLYLNVGATAFVAGEIEDSEVLAVLGAPVTAGITGMIPVRGTDPLVSLLVTSLLDGSTNAFLTLRIGVLARRHCGLKLQEDRSALRRVAAMEAAGLLATVVAQGAQRLVRVTRRAVAEGAVRGTAGMARGAVTGTGRAAKGVAGVGVKLVEAVGALAGKATEKPIAMGERALEESLHFWESVANSLRGKGEAEDSVDAPRP